MAMTYATITGKIVVPGTTTGVPGELRATPMTNGNVLSFPDENTTTIGPARADVGTDGTLTPSLMIPTDVPTGTLWRLVFYPKRLTRDDLPVRLGDYRITASGDLADLVPTNPEFITPTLALQIQAAASGGSLTVVSGGTVSLDSAKPNGTLLGYRVTVPTTIENALFNPGTYIFERNTAVFPSGWTYRQLPEAAELPEGAGWTVYDGFTAANGTAIHGRTTTQGGKTWSSPGGGLTQGGAAAAATITTNAVINNYMGGIQTHEAHLDFGSTDVEVSVDFDLTFGTASFNERRVIVVVGAGASSTNTLALSLRGDGEFMLYKGGIVAVTLSGVTTGHPRSGTLTVRLNGNTLTATTSSGTATATLTPGTGWSGTGTNIGFGVREDGSRVYNFKAR